MAKKKYLFFSVLFSVYFVIFAVSPILGRAEFSRTYGQTCSAINFELLIADLLRASHETPNSRIHTANVLLKKKGAILSDSSKPIGDHGQCVSSSTHPDVPDKIRHAIAQKDGADSSQYVQWHHSGLSPPSA